MSDQPTIRIKGKPHDYPASSKLGDAALIERLTGLTHAEWRRRYRESLEAVINDDETVEEDSAISIGIVAMAVARQNPRWSRGQVVEYVNDLDWEQVEFEAGDADPPAESGVPAPTPPKQPSGNVSVSQSSSESDTDSKESTTPPTSGTATSPMSPVVQSVSTT